MVVLYRVEFSSGDVTCFEIASDGVLFVKDHPENKTGFRLVNDHVEYRPREIPIGWWGQMRHDGTLLFPLERDVYKEDGPNGGYCDSVLWTRDEHLARMLHRICDCTKKRAGASSRIS